MTPLSEDSQKLLDTLRRVATQTIERKRRLGHHVVIWQDGKAVALGDDAPSRESPSPSKPT